MLPKVPIPETDNTLHQALQQALGSSLESPTPTPQTTGTSNNMRLPTEVLQLVFNNLPLPDLLRCQRVCRTWYHGIPGTDSHLKEILFSGSRTRMNDTYSRGFTISFRLKYYNRRILNQAPHTTWYFSVDDNFIRDAHFLSKQVLHPVFMELPHFTYLANSNFDRHGTLRFTSLQELYYLTKPQTMMAQSDSLRNAYICVPPVQNLNIRWRYNHVDLGRTLKVASPTELNNENGVTVGDLIDVLRAKIATLHEVVKLLEALANDEYLVIPIIFTNFLTQVKHNATQTSTPRS
ncbi:hypothetical protein BDV95DRAFT_596229 [Massariosphaeria phaeospora]|uniref:F-box domain-containing protein n=1 Tax=Massariosphaeria phaeospora TaxID=100035 RepID=A0A7C8ICT2_9PLEO|nr:hypothetical protein BDV95DRAFT_596229 [Massariosphaeria phaeospora]